MGLEINLKDLVIFKGKKRFVKGIAGDVNSSSYCVLLTWDKSWAPASFDEPPTVFVLESHHLWNYMKQGFKLDLEQIKIGKEYCWVHFKDINFCDDLGFVVNEINLELDK